MEDNNKNTNIDNQTNNRPWLWKKGQSGNLKGRPKGKTMKEYIKEYLACMTEEERQEFLNGIPKEIIWKMAEGNPQDDITSGGEKINPIPIIKVHTEDNNVIHTDNSNGENYPNEKENSSDTGGNIGQ
jgi:hypothetical protein